MPFKANVAPRHHIPKQKHKGPTGWRMTRAYASAFGHDNISNLDYPGPWYCCPSMKYIPVAVIWPHTRQMQRIQISSLARPATPDIRGCR